MARILEPEILDDLPPADPAAQQSRKDLRRLNGLMAHGSLVGEALSGLPRCGRICDLGGGDGSLMLAVARRGKLRDVELTIVDRVGIVPDATRSELERLGWKLVVAEGDVHAFLRSCPDRYDAIVANLFLHHFDDTTLEEMLGLAAQRCSTFVACEPRRSPLAAFASRCVGLIGCNRVTQHDAIKSVQAGFAGNEIGKLWPHVGWVTVERKAGLFSHLFTAVRQ